LNLTGSVWFFLLVGKAGTFTRSHFCLLICEFISGLGGGEAGSRVVVEGVVGRGCGWSIRGWRWSF
jgi:hypothetical protein